MPTVGWTRSRCMQRTCKWEICITQKLPYTEAEQRFVLGHCWQFRGGSLDFSGHSFSHHLSSLNPELKKRLNLGPFALWPFPTTQNGLKRQSCCLQMHPLYGN